MNKHERKQINERTQWGVAALENKLRLMACVTDAKAEGDDAHVQDLYNRIAAVDRDLMRYTREIRELRHGIDQEPDECW